MNLHRSRASRWRLHGLSPVVVEAAETVQLKGSFSLLRAPEIRQAPVGNLKLGPLKTMLNPNLGTEMWGIPIQKVPHMIFFGWEKNGCM